MHPITVPTTSGTMGWRGTGGRTIQTQQIQMEWEQARDDFKEAVREIPSDQFPGDLLYPWGDERGSITQLIEYMIEHDDEHRTEIVKAIQTSAEI